MPRLTPDSPSRLILTSPDVVALTPDQVIATTAEVFDVRVADVVGQGRQDPVSKVRAITMLLCREWTRLSFPALGIAFARDHSTVQSGVRKGLKVLETGAYTRQVVEIRRRLERQGGVASADTTKSFLRPTVTAFAIAMEIKLQKYDDQLGRRGWANASREELFADLIEHAAKLMKRAVSGADPAQLQEDAVDVANYCLMVADNLGRSDRPDEAVRGEVGNNRIQSPHGHDHEQTED